MGEKDVEGAIHRLLKVFVKEGRTHGAGGDARHGRTN